MRAVIRGTGMHVPRHVVDNHRLARLMDTSHEWIVQRTGIETRHFAALDESTSDLAVLAAGRALEDAGVDRSAVDYLILATMTPDHYFPGSAPLVQHKLGLGPVGALDVRQQCSGFLYGLQIADAVLRSGQAHHVLVVGAEVHGGFMPWRSWDVALGQSERRVDPEEYAWNTRFRDRTVLFGDAAGAFLLVGDEGGERGIEAITVHADGSHAEQMWVDGGGSAYRPYFAPRMAETGALVPIVEGREVFRLAVTLMPEVVLGILERQGYTLDDLDLLIPHQANLRISEAVQKRLRLPDHKVFNNIERYGNTTAATLPLAFHEARTARDLRPGALVCFVALGSGLTWGAALYRC